MSLLFQAPRTLYPKGMMKTSNPSAYSVVLLVFSVLVCSPSTIHAQCTRSCGSSGSNPASGQLTPGQLIPLYNVVTPSSVIEDVSGNLYFTVYGLYAGGVDSLGAVIKLDPTGKATLLYSFPGGPSGAYPEAPLILDSTGNLYGTTTQGGASNCVLASIIVGCGVVFKLDSAGNETVLHNFTNGADGAYPASPLLLASDGNLYGSTSYGGVGHCGGVVSGAGDSASGCGVVFKMDLSGNETTLYQFTGEADGASPQAVLRDNDGNLYGTTAAGGMGCFSFVPGCGVLFKIDPSGNETVLHDFSTDGDNTYAGNLLMDASGNLYTTTYTTTSGTQNYGQVLKFDLSGNETVLFTFTGGVNGANPTSPLVLDSAGNFYGATSQGGYLQPPCSSSSGCGVVFKIDPSGNETVLYRFTGGADGSSPSGALLLDGSGNLYGSTATSIFMIYQATAGTVLTGTPIFSLAAGAYPPGQTVAISDATPGATIYYTTDGTTPTTSAAIYQGPITVNSSQTIQSFAVAMGTSNSLIASAAYTIFLPDFSLTAAYGRLTTAAGAQVTDVITIAPQNVLSVGTIELSCTVFGPPPLPVCGLNPASVSFANPSSASTLTIAVPSTAAMIAPSIDRHLSQSRYASLILLTAMNLILCRWTKEPALRYVAVCCFFLIILVQVGCGGSGTMTVQHPSQNYTVTVTGTSSPAIQHSIQVTVNVP